MKYLCIIQARVGSQRLPWKVLEDIEGMPLIGRVIERVSRSTAVDEIVVATSWNEDDDALVKIAQEFGVQCYRGSEEDVLDRFVHAVRKFGADMVLRITGDCPLLEPSVIDEVIDLYKECPADYVCIQNYPRGVGDAELLSPEALERTWETTSADDRYYREHVMPYLVEHPDMFRLRVEEAPERFRRPNLRVCVDESDDLQLVRAVYGHFAPRSDFSLAEMIALLDARGDIARLNKSVRQREAVLVRPRIAFLVAAGAQIGMGHLVRCGALATAIRDVTLCDVDFVTTTPDLIPEETAGFSRVVEIPKGMDIAVPGSFSTQFEGVDALIVDLPTGGSTCVESIRSEVSFIAQITDEDCVDSKADLVIDPNLGGVLGADCPDRYLGGREAIILREQFHRYANCKRIHKESCRRLLVCFGGSDPGKLTERVLRAMTNSDIADLEVLAVLGSAYGDCKSIRELIGQRAGWQVVSELSDMAGSMWEVDVAVISGGSLMYEACALGTPAIVISQNELQDREAQFLSRKGAVIALGMHDSMSDAEILAALRRLSSDWEGCIHLANMARTAIDTKGAERVANRVLAGIQKSRR